MKSPLQSFLKMAMRLLPTSAKPTSTGYSTETRSYNTIEMESFTLSTKEFRKYPQVLTLTPYLHTHGVARTINSTLILKSTAASRIWKHATTIGYIVILTNMTQDTQEIVVQVVLNLASGGPCLAETTLHRAFPTEQAFNYSEV